MIQYATREDPGIETLIDLHGEIVDQDEGYWIKIEAWRVDPTAEIPHGIRYALTLHEPYGKRILGYDNVALGKAEKVQICRTEVCF